MKAIKIEVTKEDIAKGRAGSCSFCPVALAVKRKIISEYKGERVFPSILLYYIEIKTESSDHITSTLYYCKNPTIVRLFISLFDKDETKKLAKPFSFELELPEELINSE